jgi:hypothetical protein
MDGFSARMAHLIPAFSKGEGDWFVSSGKVDFNVGYWVDIAKGAPRHRDVNRGLPTAKRKFQPLKLTMKFKGLKL